VASELCVTQSLLLTCFPLFAIYLLRSYGNSMLRNISFYMFLPIALNIPETQVYKCFLLYLKSFFFTKPLFNYNKENTYSFQVLHSHVSSGQLHQTVETCRKNIPLDRAKSITTECKFSFFLFFLT
jgi:hypothetical protein